MKLVYMDQDQIVGAVVIGDKVCTPDMTLPKSGVVLDLLNYHRETKNLSYSEAAKYMERTTGFPSSAYIE